MKKVRLHIYEAYSKVFEVEDDLSDIEIADELVDLQSEVLIGADCYWETVSEEEDEDNND